MTKDLARLAAQAYEAFAESGPGDVDDEHAPRLAWKVQLRKACWYLGAAQRVRFSAADPGPSVAVVELGLSAVERTLQALLMHQHGYEPEHFRLHGYAIEQAGQRGLITDEVSLTLSSLWADIRSENYYRSGIPTNEGARKVLLLSEELHRQLVRRKPAYRGTCVCA